MAVVERVSGFFDAGVGSVSQVEHIVDSHFIFWIFTMLYDLRTVAVAEWDPPCLHYLAHDFLGLVCTLCRSCITNLSQRQVRN